ncbi:MAG TPA: rhodanese-like domain-containing protein [Actinomycetota bacterium]|jgi:rhodanese-related sulfurtransferase|nr:rhodanese-like domain-containing protein [Actinomycetota bacterium]
MTTPAAERTIEREELREKLARGETVKLVMAGSEWAFRSKHLPGSLHFDPTRPTALLRVLGHHDDIVVYCSNLDCQASRVAYRRLVENGYTNVRHYQGGLLDWEGAGLPLEGEGAGAGK